MKYKAIIFDMDGTIIDTVPVWSQVNKRFIESKGITVTKELEEELHKRIHGMALGKVCAIIKEMVDLKDPLDQLMQEKIAIACALYKEGIAFIEGFEPFHERVISSNLKSGIATNADDYTLAITKEMLGIERFFGEHIYNIAHVGYVPKPDPAIYLYTAEKLSVNPEMCIAIEDSPAGIRSAKSAGMFCIGINTAGDRKQVQEAHHIVDKYEDIDLSDLLKIKK
jgi:HAD superfamily hydrolase (TIGR01509 family)